MSQLTVRCLGGFEVRLDERQVTGFESSKVKALLAYLLVGRGQTFTREHLAALLWSEKPDEVARRNLRQTVYNLKSALAGGDEGPPPILANGDELRIHPELDCWLDVETFDDAHRRGTSAEAVDSHYLASAVALYRGDFLAGFSVKGCPEFEFWQLSEQERLHDQAIEALRILVESYLARGEFRLGIQYARRLVAIDPLSEVAHRHLMRLYSLAGSRSRACTQYEQLRESLRRELGVEPLEETRALYEALLTEDSPSPQEEEGAAQEIGPLIPLVGRQEPYRRLGEDWRAVLEGRCRLTIVEGEAGIGKTRLVKSFLDAAGSRRLMTVLKGGCSDLVPTGFQPFTQLLANAVAEDSQRPAPVLQDAPAEVAADVARLVPAAGGLGPISADPEPAGRAARDRLFASIAWCLERLCRPAADAAASEPLVLMLSDLQWAGRETADLITVLLERLADSPVWILATCCPGAAAPPFLRRVQRGDGGSRVSHVVLDRLGPEAVEELALALVGDDQAIELARFLHRRGQGLPLAVAEWINSLWDECVLAHDAGRWYLKESLSGRSGDLDQLIQKRLQRLPDSTRRLASQAAVLGLEFDARLLQKAANEHLRVVEVGLELMLERWLIRQHTRAWMTGRREHDIVLWAKGARRGSFEFNHRMIWRSVLEDVNPLRRQVMHRRVAETLEAELGDDSERHCEALAFHSVQGGLWDRAFVHLSRAARKARALPAGDTARHYLRQGIQVADRLLAAARDAEEAQAWTRRRNRMTTELEEIERQGL